uniref:Arrestin C-terminal-like domain-containing protein n=1 Tax=Takifugu rubripes TaxID=31033 RepID=A0A674N211_TAKRU
MSPIKDFKLLYVAPNKENVFSGGDTVAGKVTFTLKEETKVKGVAVKVKGEAHVHWSDGTGDRKKSHSDHRRYFKDKVVLVEEGKTVQVENPTRVSGNFLSVLCHELVALKTNRSGWFLPQRDFPSSFKGFHGKIVYTLEAKISRSWRVPSFEHRELRFVSTSTPPVGPATVGEIRRVKFEENIKHKQRKHVSLDTKLKFSLQQKIVYRAFASTTLSDLSLCKMVGETIKGNSEETFSCQMKIPDDAVNTVHNCDIIFVDYYIKVYVDISLAIDPEVKLPVVITSRLPTPGYSDFPPPAFAPGPYPVPAPPGAYGYPAPNPTPYGNTGGYNTYWPQQPAPYGFPAPAFPSSIDQQPMPNAPPLFQPQPPPDYGSLYPPVPGSYSDTGPPEKQ